MKQTKEAQNNLISNKHYLASCNIPPKPLNNLVAALVDLKNPPHFNVNTAPRYTKITDKNTEEEFFALSSVQIRNTIKPLVCTGYFLVVYTVLEF